MAKCIVLIRLEPAQVKGKGADRGEVVAIREADSRITEVEKAEFLLLKVELTKTQLKAKRAKVHPRASFVAIGSPGIDDMEAYQTWIEEMSIVRQALPSYGLTVDFEDLSLSDEIKNRLNNLTQKIEPITADKAILREK